MQAPQSSTQNSKPDDTVIREPDRATEAQRLWRFVSDFWLVVLLATLALASWTATQR